MNLIRIQGQIINADQILAAHIEGENVCVLLPDRTLELDGASAEILKNWLHANAMELTADMEPREMRSRSHMMAIRPLPLNRPLFKRPAAEG